ncbi:MAG: cell division protein ZapE [Alphaproteobacteria bacterium]|jgi:cell division protein ZapE|nr:cell division protein ZapE [Alphaproteobacteria bacterium]
MLLPRYQQLIDSGTLQADEAQMSAAEHLSELQARILAGKGGQKSGRWPLLSGGRKAQHDKAATHTQGVYLYGAVGRGKSLLMDLFCETLPLESKRRVHFHAFMLEVHGALAAHRKTGGKRDPLRLVAADIAASLDVLCLDEFLVSDIVSAMLLQGLLEALFDEGVYLVTTSNFPPDALYPDGLQRERFLGCITLLNERLNVLSLESRRDYRTQTGLNQARFLTPLNAMTEHQLRQWFAEWAKGTQPAVEHLPVQGRFLRTPASAGDAALLSFSEICGQALGNADYLALAGRYKALVLDGIPIFTNANQDQAKRFMLLIDALYESRVRLACRAAAAPEHLYREGFFGFEFKRTVSRLIALTNEGEA